MMIPKPTRFTKMVRTMTRSGRDTDALLFTRDSFGDGHTLDHHRLHRNVVHAAGRASSDRADLRDDVHPGDDPAEHGVPEIARREAAMIELAVVGEIDVELRRRA